MAEEKKPELDQVPPQVSLFGTGGHKNTAIGPKTGLAVPDWRMDRDYEKFNPTAEK